MSHAPDDDTLMARVAGGEEAAFRLLVQRWEPGVRAFLSHMLGSAEEAEGRRLKRTFDAVGKLVPYLKLVERERMRLPDKSEQAYEDFFASDEFGRLFDSLIANKLAISQITSLLADGPLSTVEIAESLSLSPSAVSKHMNSTSRQGLVTYDVDQRRYALA